MKNDFNCKRKLLFLMFWTFLLTMAKAQPNLAFYPLDKQFNSFDYNPAFLTSREKFTFSMFPLGGISLSYNNQEVIRSMASKFVQGEITDDDYKKVFKNMVNQTSFHQNFEGTLLSFTYRSAKGFFNFRIKDSEYFLTKVKGDATKFIFNSEIQSAVINQIQYLPAQAAHTREYSLGYSYKSPSRRFSAGIRAKLYFGKFAFSSNIKGSIQEDQTSPNQYLLKTEGILKISFPDNTISNDTASTSIVFTNSTIFKYIFNNDNLGMGVDLGAHYQLTPEWSFSASIIDLGKIHYDSNLDSRSLNEIYALNDTTYRITTEGGVQTINKIENFTYSDTFDFSDLNHEKSPFSMPLPLNLYAGIKYQVNPGLSLGFTDRYVGIKDLSYNSLAVSANYDINKKLTISSGYSLIGDSYFNIPLGILYEGNLGQVFLATDNLTSILFPSGAEYASFSFGACFYLFTKRNLDLKPSDDIPFYKPRKIKKNGESGLIIQENPEE